MLSAVKLQVSSSSPAMKSNSDQTFAANFPSRRSLILRLPERRLASLSFQSTNHASSHPSIPSHFTSTVGSLSPSLHSNLTQRHILVLNVIACAVAISATWLFCSAIPTLLAFKRAAESLEKLLDVTREELPDTMAAVRLSGMEISDLTMELSDIGTRGILLFIWKLKEVIKMMENMKDEWKDKVDEWKDMWQDKIEDGRNG